ncbi:tRNA 2-selenouridine(34) synthase MnmH [Pseudoponticoccus marisrubri]|uniref:tRNA 2-selenouridine synthase n=1 Tax=Pseudoponticoccus marisrubri TaxID=1685382 RepID=A0A0W7WQR9_9RHOB|nr:tRNA 2-selenouridine(34) synthase MnmH [Pseudoponticoccus marisrubri]KUF12824.1 tRNA 2-selenouridine synthase [Pseudoponticoccus marisrubri]
MSQTFTTLHDLFSHGYDSVIDVRSPSEFAEDHVPGALSLPVLDDAERSRVGTMYKQVSPFDARKIGAALVFRNAAQHVETRLAHHDGAWRPLVYCWRGGQRSGAFAWMLREIGWRAETIDGGYRSFRRLVVETLYDAALPHRFLQLGGYTGTAKTALLPRLAARGIQTLDLEGLAQHRGSLLGDLPGGQPSQKAFETRLAQQLSALDPARPVVVEAESSKIGARLVPQSLWAGMKVAPWIEVEAPLDARARYLAEAYADILADAPTLRARLDPLRYHRGHALVDAWNDLIARDARVELCRSLAETHYDPAYDKAKSATAPRILARLSAEGLQAPQLDDLADRIAETVHSVTI